MQEKVRYAALHRFIPLVLLSRYRKNAKLMLGNFSCQEREKSIQLEGQYKREEMVKSPIKGMDMQHPMMAPILSNPKELLEFHHSLFLKNTSKFDGDQFNIHIHLEAFMPTHMIDDIIRDTVEAFQDSVR